MSAVRTISGIAGAVGAAAAGGYLGRRRLFPRLLGIRPATHDVDVDRNVRVRVDDGVTLATDVYHPRGAPVGPAVLVRTPYGRRGWSGGLSMSLSRRFAERGYRVVSQDVRGRFDSDGEEFAPYVHERDDGAATAAWIVAQPWSDGRVATWGPSYLGYTQWALAASDGSQPAAMVPITTAANLAAPGPGDTIGLDATLRWILMLDAMENTELALRERLARIALPTVQNRLLTAGFDALPLAGADAAVIGRTSRAWQMWVERAGPDEVTWDEVDHTAAVGRVTAPVHMITGWFDLFLTRQLDDYSTLVAAGRRPFLTIGPWHHLNPRMQLEGLRAGLDWLDAHLRPPVAPAVQLRRNPVRIFVTGAEEWRDLPAWPPSAPRALWYLAPGGALAQEPVGVAHASTSYRYDPADPTPGIGGALLSVTAGSVDNRPLERRDDVVTFTTAPFDVAREVVGVPCVRVHLAASSRFVDVVARLCDVHPDGRSMNLADGHLRLSPQTGPDPSADGTFEIEVALSPLAHRVLAGHRLRLQVASGAHPRIARNLGTDEPTYAGTRLQPVDVEIRHDRAHHSALDLPLPG